jgi:Fe2+ or Zn2+ uptake regulation protein
VARKKSKGTELSVFKGREAKLNRAIFQVLANKGSQTIYDIHKEMIKYKGLRNSRYSTVNKRVRFMEESGYINKTAAKKTKAGFQAIVYELATKSYLAMLLNSLDLNQLLSKVHDDNAETILAAILNAL